MLCITGALLFAITSIVVVVYSKHKALQIIGGQSAADNQFPYQISMRYNDSHRCGGSVAHPDWILTAAHCVNELKANQIYVVAGSRFLAAGGQRYDVSQIIVHEGLDLSKFVNDVALLRLAKSIEMGPAVQVIPIGKQFVKKAESAVMSGWGLNLYPKSQAVPNEMQYLYAKILTNLDCKIKSGLGSASIIHESTLCTYYGSKGHGECFGDSGGPLALDGVQVGITSWVRPCAAGYPDGFMRVSFYHDWIKSKMATALPTQGVDAGAVATGANG